MVNEERTREEIEDNNIQPQLGMIAGQENNFDTIRVS